MRGVEKLKKAVCEVCGNTINADGTKPLGEMECTECSSSGVYIPEIEMLVTTEIGKRTIKH
ncbi:MAG: hypothetical protein JXA98_08545 [Methanosarcinaceae archaeon]|nr:hypothetical protein [Methanosarcinaceae archaeon]